MHMQNKMSKNRSMKSKTIVKTSVSHHQDEMQSVREAFLYLFSPFLSVSLFLSACLSLSRCCVWAWFFTCRALPIAYRLMLILLCLCFWFSSVHFSFN